MVTEEYSLDSSDEEAALLMRVELFSDSAPGKKQIQFTRCKHEQCCDAGPFYVCCDCESD